MKIAILAIYAFLLVQAIVSGSYADVPSSNPSASRIQYEQDVEASSKSTSVASLGAGRIPRQSRCIRCSYAYDDRYGAGYGYKSYADDYYPRPYVGNRQYYDGAAAAGRGGYDDRNWYYYPDRYDDRMSRYQPDRYYDRYGSSALNVIDPSAPKKYDDRYASRTYDRYDAPYVPAAPVGGVGGGAGYYDRNEYRPYYNDYRGNGYDNRGGDYYRGGADRFYDRYRGGYSGGYEGRYNDRDIYDRYYYNKAGPMDYRHYRPWEDTYRGQPGFDGPGERPYYAGRPDDLPPLPPPQSSFHYRPAPPPQPPPYPYHEGDRNAPPSPSRPYSPHQPVRPLRPDSPSSSAGSSPRAPGDSSAPPSSQSSSGSAAAGAPSGDRTGRPENDPNQAYAGRWNYLEDRDKGSGYHQGERDRDHNQDRDMGGGRDKDSQSTAYGSRPRPLGGAYLLDRDSNKPVAINGENKDGRLDDQAKVAAGAFNDNESVGSGGASSSSSTSGDTNKN